MNTGIGRKPLNDRTLMWSYLRTSGEKQILGIRHLGKWMKILCFTLSWFLSLSSLTLLEDVLRVEDIF